MQSHLGLPERAVCTSTENWKRIAKGFENIWNLPHCIGAIDGKYVSIKSPLNSGSLYYNYKGFLSIILMAICAAHYMFFLVDIGSFGSNNANGVFRNSPMGKAFLIMKCIYQLQSV